MSNTTDKMLDRYVYLQHIEPCDRGMGNLPITVNVKLDDEGVAVDAWQEDECFSSTWKTYNDMGVEVKELENE